ncbi:MAG: hypothetical protein RIG77_16435 [Cyclobacteriaceae bacterium]
MTKYDIRIKRRALSKGQISRHKDFSRLRNFQQATQHKSSSLIRIILIAVAVSLLIGMTVLGILKVNEKKTIPQHDGGMEVFEEFKP